MADCEAQVEQKLLEIFDHPEAEEVWFWDGDFDHVLGCVTGQEEKWLVERGVLRREDVSQPGVKDLVVGDVVYRIRKAHALERREDPREVLFEWWYTNPITKIEQLRSAWARSSR